MNKKVVVAMSGGVDSSVAALLLKEQGWDVVGITMCLSIPAGPGSRPGCCGPEGVRDARKVCDTLGVPHYVFDFSRQMQAHVIDDFFSEYRSGRTPNPCVRCNGVLKFDLLLNKARVMGFDHIATGHYARIRQIDGAPALARARDDHKDQSYFLYSIPRPNLESVLFPLGEYVKDETRELAAAAGLPVASKAESQDICFITEGSYRDFLVESATPGDIVAVDGTVLGRHTGIVNYTIGQRRGLGIAHGRPLYVVALDRASNQVVVGDEKDLLCRGLEASNLNLLVDTLPQHCTVRIRYAGEGVGCTIATQGEQVCLEFDHPQRAVTPGQSAVFYDGDIVLGGGIIDKAVA